MANFLRWLVGRPAGPDPAPADAGSPATALVSRGPALVTLYDRAGDAVQVQADRVEHWLAQGFRPTRLDLRQATADLAPQAEATRRALLALVAEAEGAAALSPAALATAQAAASELAEAIAGILSGVQLAYGVAEPEPVAMLDPDGAAHRIDPNQVAQYRDRGFREVAA